jgi:hypothetical protein
VGIARMLQSGERSMQRFRARITIARLRVRVSSTRSVLGTVALVLSGLPFEINRLRHQLEALHDDLQVILGAAVDVQS